MRCNLTTTDWLLIALVVIGGLNWGLVGLFQYNLVGDLFGVGSMISRLIYVLVGLSALILFFRSVASDRRT